MAPGIAPFHGAKLALFLGGRLVCIRRDDILGIAYPDYWDFPGGGREGAETPLETAARELDEELGLDLSAARVLWHLETEVAHLPGERAHFFVAQLPGAHAERIRFGDEGQGWALFTISQVLALPKLVPAYSARLKHYLNMVETGQAEAPE